MTESLVAVQVPEPVYRRLQGAAVAAKRSVGDVLTSAVTVALPPSPDLPEALADELAEMIWLSDEALWQATTPTFTKAQQERLAMLNDLSDDRPLTAKEKAEQVELLFAYEQSVLRRAQAFAILSRRGHHLPTYSTLAARA
jgi:hypothetical protein